MCETNPPHHTSGSKRVLEFYSIQKLYTTAKVRNPRKLPEACAITLAS